MREITWSVKGTPNVLVQSLPYWTSKSWAHSLIYGHFQQHSYGYLRTYAVNLDTAVRFDPVRVQNFGDLATFTVDFCILYAECPPCFYFQFAWPTDLESIPHASTPTSIIPTKFEAPAPIYSWVMSYNVSHFYDEKCIRGHCACSESRDPRVWVKNNYIFRIPDPDLPIQYTIRYEMLF